MANPRKFSEKIALHNQKQAEETAAFERIMQEVSVTRQPQHLHPHPTFLRASYLGGSLPNVNQMSGPPMEMPMRPGPYEEFKPPHRHQLRFDTRPRPYMQRRPDFQNRHPRTMEAPPGGPYGGPAYLSPPADSSWRRTNSDSALHQSVMNPNAQETFTPFNNPPSHLAMMPPPPRRDFMDIHAEKLHQQLVAATNRPKSCEDSQMNVLQNADSSGLNVNHRQGLPPPNPTNAPGLSHVTQIGNNTGSLPDLTNLHIPSPLSNPIDYEDQQKQLSQNHQQPATLQSPQSMLYNQARSTGNLNSASAINPHLGAVEESPKSGNIASRIYCLLRKLESIIEEETQYTKEKIEITKRTGAVSELFNDLERSNVAQNLDEMIASETSTCNTDQISTGTSRSCEKKKMKRKIRDIEKQRRKEKLLALKEGLNARGSPASPSRSRRHTHNGPSPLSLGSQDQNRRMKFPGVTSPKMGAIKPDLKSPPIGGPYPYSYPIQGPGMDARGQGPIHRQMQQHLSSATNSIHPALRVDVNAASKVGQYPSHTHQMSGHRHPSGPSMTSPITSPTSPTSHGSLSPGASPQHLPELTSTSNPALSEAYFRTDLTSMQPLQHQFEQFHVVNDIGSSAGLPHTSMPPPVYSSSLQLLGGDSPFSHNAYGVPQQRSSDSSIYTCNNGSNSLLYKNLISSKIPDIVFTGVDDPQSSKGMSCMDSLGYPTGGMPPGASLSDFASDYFPGDDLKVNLGLEELQMLEETKLIDDPSMEEELRLNTT